jgi:hypothetical protein
MGLVVLLAAVAILLIEPMLRSWIKWRPVWRAADFAQRRFFSARMAEPTSRFE